MNWATGIDPKTGRPTVNPEARYDTDRQACIVRSGPGRRAHLAADELQPADQAGVFPGDGSRFRVHPARPNSNPARSAGTPACDFNAGSLPTDPKALAGIKQQLKGHLVAWDPGGAEGGLARAVRASLERRHARDRRAISCSREIRRANSSLIAPATARSSGRRRRRLACLRRRSATRSTVSNTSPSKWAGAAPSALRPASWRVTRTWRRTFPACWPSRSAETRNCPALPDVLPAKLDPPPEIGDAATWTAGKAVFHTYCSVCHGDSAVSGGVLPDLRLSAITRDAAAWERIVRGGERSARGMVSFARKFHPRKLKRCVRM